MTVLERPFAVDERVGEWVKCTGCGWPLYARRLARHMHVCPECGYHHPIDPRERIAQLVDRDSFVEMESDPVVADPLAFHDRRPYVERIRDAAAATGETDAAVFGTATVNSHPVVVLAMDFRFMGGSMGAAVGESVARAAEEALETRRPLILVCASGGARMQEGVVSLFQMAKTSQVMARLHEAGVLSICVLTNPTFGGVTASFAMLGSVLIAETGALVGFAGQRVISQTIRQELPDGFQTSEFLMKHGAVDRVETRSGLRPLIGQILGIHRNSPGAGSDTPSVAIPAVDVSALRRRDPWHVVLDARERGRPTALDYAHDAFDDFVELHGDRCFGDDPAIVGGLARIGDHSFVVIGHQKGHDTKQLVDRNFGMPHPEGYRKVNRLFEYAERFDMPVVTLIDTPGAYPGVRAEEHGQSAAIAQTIMRLATLRVPTIALVTGEGGSGGALALATCDRFLVMENAYFSVISPEGCAAILWRTAESAPEAARSLRITAPDLLDLGIADAVVAEPPDGAHTDAIAAARILRETVAVTLDEVTRIDLSVLLAGREERFRRVGSPTAGDWPAESGAA